LNRIEHLDPEETTLQVEVEDDRPERVGLIYKMLVRCAASLHISQVDVGGIIGSIK